MFAICRDAQNNLLPGDEAIAGSVETVHIELSFSNIGEDPAFGSELSFTLPARYTFVQALVPAGVTPVSVVICCTSAQKSPNASGGGNYREDSGHIVKGQQRKLSCSVVNIYLCGKVEEMFVSYSKGHAGNFGFGQVILC